MTTAAPRAMRIPKTQFEFTEPEVKPMDEDSIDLDAVERVTAYRAWLKADREFYGTPRESRVGKPPRMANLPSRTDYMHAAAYEALD